MIPPNARVSLLEMAHASRTSKAARLMATALWPGARGRRGEIIEVRAHESPSDARERAGG